MAKNSNWLAGWTRIDKAEFLAKAAAALTANPDLRLDLHAAIRASAARCEVPGETISQYLGWLDEAAATANQ